MSTSGGNTSRRKPKYAAYDGWTAYSGTNTDLRMGWQYKTGKYQGETCVFYRKVQYSENDGGRKRQNDVLEHRTVCILLSKNPSIQQWQRMRAACSAKSNTKSIKVHDFRVANVSSTRKRAAKLTCTNCSVAIISTVNHEGICSACRMVKLRKKRKHEEFEKKKLQKQTNELLEKEEQLLALKFERQEQEKKIREYKNTIKKKMNDINELQQALLSMELNNRNLQNVNQTNTIELTNKIDELNLNLNDGVLAIRDDVSAYKKASSDVCRLKDEISNLSFSAIEMNKTIGNLQVKCDTFAKDLVKLKTGLLTPSENIFGISLLEDFYYFGIHRCGSTSTTAGATGIERFGMVGVYNIKLKEKIENALSMKIPVVKDGNGHEGARIDLDKLSFIRPSTPWLYGTRDIVFKESSSLHKSLRSNRELILPLLKFMLNDELYDSGPLEKLSVNSKGMVIKRTFKRSEIAAMKQGEYQKIFLMVWKYHFEKGTHQTSEDKPTEDKPKGTYLSYAQYLFTILQEARVSLQETHHGRAFEHNPVSISLHTYCITHTFEFDDPCLRLSAAGQAKEMDGYAESVVRAINLRS